jgi:hypothetical protein
VGAYFQGLAVLAGRNLLHEALQENPHGIWFVLWVEAHLFLALT